MPSGRTRADGRPTKEKGFIRSSSSSSSSSRLNLRNDVRHRQSAKEEDGEGGEIAAIAGGSPLADGRVAEAEGGRARDRNGRDVIRYSAKIFIPPLGAPPLPPTPTGRTIATTMSCSPGARSSGRRDGHDPREGGQGRTDKHAGREGGAPRALHSSSVASRFRSLSISGSVSGSCRDCSTWHRDCSRRRSSLSLLNITLFHANSRAPIREKGPVGIPVKLSPNIISYMPTIVYMEAGIQTLEEKDWSIWSQIHSDKSCGQTLQT